MSGRLDETPQPDGNAHVPEAVLDELLAAFGVEIPAAGTTTDAGDQPAAPEQPATSEIAASSEMAESPARRTIVIADDDQPDAVHLDEEGEDRLRAVHPNTHAGDDTGDRATIQISDLDEGVVIEPAPTAGSAGMDPRFRARRVAVRRKEGKRRLVWLGVGAGVIVLAVAAVAVVASPIFDVRDVRVQGAAYTDPALVEAVVSEIQGDPVLLVDTSAIEERLEADAWVERAKVSIDFPHGVVIDIRERQPLATFQGGDGQWRVIDIDGRVLDVIAGQPIAYMLVSGDHPDTARGQYAGAPYAAAALLVQSLPSELRLITDSIGLDAATGTMTMQLEGGIEVRLGDATDMDIKLARLLSQVRSGLDGVTALDVSTDEIGVIRG